MSAMLDKLDKERRAEEKERKEKEKEEGLRKIKKERDEYLDGWKRAKADLINYKKDELKRLEEIAKFANEELMRDLVEVIDSFDLALASMEKENPAEKGILLIKNKLEGELKKRGMQRIKADVGEPFNPNVHEAIGMVEREDGKDENTIAEVVEVGYMLYGKVLRPARVNVYK